MIIGVCGTFASGKDTVAEYVAKTLGYVHVSTGDLIRDYIKSNHLGGIDRRNMVKVGNDIRRAKGSGYLVKEALKRHPDKVVVSGIRSTGEAQALTDAGGHLLAVDAPIERRFEWAKARGRIGDGATLDFFRQQELIEIQNTSEHEQRINDVIAMAADDVANDGSLSDLHAKVNAVLARFKEAK